MSKNILRKQEKAIVPGVFQHRGFVFLQLFTTMQFTKKTYGESLKDPRWQKRRLEILSRDEWKCVWCGTTKNTLHVHHLYYSGTFPWETEDEGLQTVCSECHDINHLNLSELEKNLIDVIRNRDRECPEMIKMLNSFVRHSVKDRENGKG